MNTPLVRYQNFISDSDRWKGFRFRPGDIVISTPAKCGTTWTQRICALLIFQTTKLDKPLTTSSPWFDMITDSKKELLANLESQNHRRFIKTHTPLDGLPYDENVTYLCVGRDPRDVALSWDGHMMNTDIDALLRVRERAIANGELDGEIDPGIQPPAETPHERFWNWVHDPTVPQEAASSLQSVLHHLSTFWSARDRRNIYFLHYCDLKADLEGQMRALALHLSIEVPEPLWPELVRAASFDQMREEADKVAPSASSGIWVDNKQFFRSGKNGGWQSMFAPDDEARYATRVSELAAPELAAWAHHGGKVG